ncbi:DHS-like NAD/FAD-binding domain-containing protein [Mycena maculata]|uniref:NAD-dependent protein deacylase n=1 Tax=Mycena maculata TaxID=230809 RepID=A0AAD7IBV5_9AGAR|nr:DHS-like NAD/FAD-binding domain-containing protein [Mycena maculata]
MNRYRSTASTRTQSTDLSEFQRLLTDGKWNNIIAVCGAGLSAASGIPTFRGAGGMWRKYDAMSLATPEAFEENPSLVWQFYHYRREAARKALPNPAHMALAELSLPWRRKVVAPNSEFSIITQNVDGLSVRALAMTLEDSKGNSNSSTVNTAPLIEMHGRLFDVLCTSKSCGYVEYNTASPICPALAAVEEPGEDNALKLDLDIPLSELPRCSKCNALARPGVVWFGEIPHELGRIDKLVEAADLCLVVGTSSTVYPAAAYASEVQDHGGKVAVFNLERSAGDRDADFLFLGPCEETLPRALGLEPNASRR